jgi:NADH-quinone oxidoreductase subunit D
MTVTTTLGDALTALQAGPLPSPTPAPDARPATRRDGLHPTVDALRARLGGAVERHDVFAGDEHVVHVSRAVIGLALEWLKESPDQAYDLLQDITAIDWGGGRPLQLAYQIRSLAHGRTLRVKTELPLTALTVPSVVGLWSGANWLEREVYDMFGVAFDGHPDLRRILMPDGYAEGHPLRKDFPLRGRFTRSEQTRRALGMEQEDYYSPAELAVAAARSNGRPVDGSVVLAEGVDPELGGRRMQLNLGPQHPATHGVLRLVLDLEGETVVGCTPHIGYLHSGFEKLGEYRTWNQIVPLTDRMDYFTPLVYNVAYVAAVEKMMGIRITERARVFRVLLMELDRIFSHLVWVGTTAMDIGAVSVFLYTFQQREHIYDLHEAYSGGRITTSATRVGGMAAEIPPGFIDATRTFIDGLPRVLDEVERLLNGNAIWLGRNRDIGVIDGRTAINAGMSGPTLRATGVPYDVRKDAPYYDYETYDFDVPIGEHGDCLDRYLVRMEEMRQSLRIMSQALDRLPDGPMNVDDPRVILPGKRDVMSDMESMIHHFKLVTGGPVAPPGESWCSVESSRGELGMYVVSDGGSKPLRWRVRGPSFLNIATLPRLVQGHLLADVLAINASLDGVLGEIDR